MTAYQCSIPSTITTRAVFWTPDPWHTVQYRRTVDGANTAPSESCVFFMRPPSGLCSSSWCSLNKCAEDMAGTDSMDRPRHSCISFRSGCTCGAELRNSENQSSKPAVQCRYSFRTSTGNAKATKNREQGDPPNSRERQSLDSWYFLRLLVIADVPQNK